MADIKADLQSYINTNTGLYLYIQALPDTPDNTAAIIEYAGLVNLQSKIVTRNFQIIVRNKSDLIAEQNIYTLFNFLDNPYNRKITVNGNWMVLLAKQTPAKLKIDERDRHLYIFNLQVLTRRD